MADRPYCQFRCHVDVSRAIATSQPGQNEAVVCKVSALSQPSSRGALSVRRSEIGRGEHRVSCWDEAPWLAGVARPAEVAGNRAVGDIDRVGQVVAQSGESLLILKCPFAPSSAPLIELRISASGQEENSAQCPAGESA
jgi:hypothetical protein